MNGLVVGLTGGIGSGKSAAAEAFSSLGAAVIDSDAIARELTAPGGAAMPFVVQEFGDDIVATDGGLNRAMMRNKVFSNQEMRKRLEAILHPMIRAESDARCNKALAAGFPYVVLVVPLLIESGGYRERVHRVVSVDCDDEVRIARVMARSGLTRGEVLSIMASQASRQERLAAADDVIDNSGNREALAARVRELHDDYLGQSATIRATG